MTGTNPERPMRAHIDAQPADILDILPAMGRVMVASSLNGATHERIGAVTSLARSGALVTLAGDAHDCRIDTSHLAAMGVDRSSRMGDKAFPRIDFRDAGGSVVFSVVGFDGLEPFDAALDPFGQNAEPPAPAAQSSAERGEVGDDDPGAVPFRDAMTGGAETIIGLRRPGFEQRWSGRIEAVKPAMGFINVMRPDFHLHLKAGSVCAWREANGEMQAAGPDGTPLGLFVSTRS